jgi:hypothetical protein
MSMRETLALASLPVVAAACSIGGERPEPVPTTLAETTISTEAVASPDELTAEQCLTIAGVLHVLGEKGTKAYFFFGDDESLMGESIINVSWLPVASETLLDSIELPDGNLPVSEAAADVIAASGTLRVAADAYDAADVEFANLTKGDAWKSNNGWDRAYDEADAMLDQARDTTMDAFYGNCDPYKLGNN